MTIDVTARSLPAWEQGKGSKPTTMIAGVAFEMAEQVMTSVEVEDRVRESSPNYDVAPGIIERLTGVKERRIAAEGQYPSHFAAAAGRRVLEQTGTDPADIDLLIFASSCQDITEPATVHIVQDLLGTNANVFDVKNACNSFLSAMHVAEAFIANGTYRNVLVTTGEVPSHAIRWQVEDEAQWRNSFPGYTVGDGGAAMLLTPATDDRGIWFTHFGSDSKNWNVLTVPGGGSRHPRDLEKLFFEGSSGDLRRAVEAIAARLMPESFMRSGATFDDFDAMLIHQVSTAGLDFSIEFSGTSPDQWVRSVVDYGNIASVTLPLQLATALDRGIVAEGGNAMIIGLAAGVSMGVMMVTV